jgi:hypothetical protein
VDDGVVDGTVNYAITLSTSSTDPAFNQLQTTPVAVQNLDNDVAAAPTLYNASKGELTPGSVYTTAPGVKGGLTEIHGSDNQRLEITEGMIALKRGQIASDLNAYQWTFNVSNARSLVFEGYRSANTVNDNFSIQFSTNNGSQWTTAFTVANTTESRFSYAVAGPLNGTVLVRAIDTNSTNKAQFANTLYVDQLAFSTASNAAGSPGRSMAEDPIIGSSLGLASACETELEGCGGLHEEEGMHFIPFDLESAPLGAGPSGSHGDGPSPIATDPLAPVFPWLTPTQTFL